MARKIPPDAFEFYLSLGPERSYDAVARRYSISKRAVVKKAVREKWQERARQIEEQARRASTGAEDIDSMNRRHRRAVEYVQARALEALKAMPLRTAMDCVRALDISIREERRLVGVDDEVEPMPDQVENLAPAFIAARDRLLRRFPGWEPMTRCGTQTVKKIEGLEKGLQAFMPIYLAKHPEATEEDFTNTEHAIDFLRAIDDGEMQDPWL